MKNLLITFSGGESSALMTKIMINDYRDKFNDVVIVFANTGEENEQTLEFVNKCDELFNFNTIWLEAVANHSERKSCSHRIVDYKTASRNSEPFEDIIKKYGIPNKAYPHCTRALKLEPITSYLNDIGWKNGDYYRAIGIRYDEENRRAKNQKENNIIYPLMDLVPMTRPDVNIYWEDQRFRLNLTGYQGNCKTCWKKSTRKLLTIMEESPQHFNFFERMELEHGTTNTSDGYVRKFFRQHLSVQDMRDLHKKGGFDMAENDAVVFKDKQIMLDFGDIDGCSAHCEVSFE